MPSTIGAATDWLVSTCGGFGSVSVLDGPMIGKPLQGDVICVGAGNESGIQSVALDTMGGASVRETYQVVCNVYSWSGDKALKPHRDRCVDLLAQLRSALAADKTMGGLVARAQLGPDLSWQQTVTGEGSACSVGFSVQVEAVV